MSRYSTTSDHQRPKKRSRKTIALLLSCCLFLLIICGCLLAALILIGKHVILNGGNVGPARPKTAIASVPKKFISRLPNDTKPLIYDLTLLPNLKTGLYAGSVNITLNLTIPRENIVLHSKNLTITNVELHRNDSDWKVVDIIDVKESVLDELLFINVNGTIPAGIYNLFIKFNGSLLNKLRGFYHSTYKRSNGEKRYRPALRIPMTFYLFRWIM